jgi:hypothetical protein
LIDAGGAADDGGVGDEGADAGVGAAVDVEDAAGVVGGTGSAVVAFSLSSSPVIRVLGGSQALRVKF